MSKKGTKALASATLMSLVLTTALSAGPAKAAAGQVTRVGEADRYATAAKVATENWKDGAKDVVLVSGEGYADAVSASALAKKLNAPIILTTANSLNDDAKEALEALKPTNVYVVGGNASVSSSVRSKLKDAKFNLVELQGKDRYETNVKVAEKLVELGVSADNVMLVGGEGFSDALSVAPVAAAKGQILLLGNNNSTSMKSVLEFVKANKSKVTVVGTSYVISDDMFKALGATERVNGGANRFETNLNVLNKFTSDLKADKLFVANATGDGYADALVASALAGKTASPLVLVDTETSASTTAALNYIKGKATKTTDLNVVGGTGVVSQNTVNAINNAVNPTNPTNPTNATVSSVTSNGLNQIKVVFNGEVDEDTAKLVSNYKLDGSQLKPEEATASLDDDKRTLTINLFEIKQQNKKYDFEVKDGVLSYDKTDNVDKYSTSLTFTDTTVPTLKSVGVRGNSKITVNFSEPVIMTVDSSGNLTSSTYTKFKINGQNISSYGLNYAEPKHKVAAVNSGVTTSTSVWADGVDFYFSSKLPTGNSTLKISEGDSKTLLADSILSDAARFVFAETSQSFTVDAVTTKPVVKEIKADADGTMWVRFDRPMDKTTATNYSKYGLNQNGNRTGGMATRNGELKEGDCTIKFQGESFNTGTNILYLDKTIKDAYGNTVDDDTRVSFTYAKDETKPTVINSKIIDSSTIRVTFSKDIDASYASKTGNYTLKDSTGLDITDHIKVVRPSKSNVSTSASISAPADNDKVWDIKMKDGDSNKLTSSKYTLEIKNLVDTTSNHNAMDKYTTTLTGNDDVAPKLNSVVAKADSDHHKVVLFFSEEMDSATLNDISNYKYKNDSLDVNNVPSSTKATVSPDNKSVTLEFPSNYYVEGTPGKDPDNIVKEILVSGVKDISGNLVDSFANSGVVDVRAGSSSVTYKSKTYKIEDDGDDLLVKFQFSDAIDSDTLDKESFRVAGEKPDSSNIDGSNIVLRFNKDQAGVTLKSSVPTYANNPMYPSTATTLEKIEAIKAQGSEADLVLVGTALKDITGKTVTSGTLATKAYDYLAKPKTTSDFWFATNNYDDGVGTTGSAVVLTFDNAIDKNSGIKRDDYTFTIDGSEVKADKVVVDGNTLVFVFKNARFTAGTEKVGVALKNTSVNIESLEDDNSNYALYSASTDDINNTRRVDVKTDRVSAH